MDLSSPVPASTEPGEPLPDAIWLQPVPDGDAVPATADPAERALQRESIRLAFVAALQQLPPRQRAVLILREVLCWHATEVAGLLDTTVASVNSALQRARATMAASGAAASGQAPAAVDGNERVLLARYVEAFESYDIDSLVALLHEEASMSMPPLAMWLSGPADMRRWYLGWGLGCRGSRLLPIAANGSPAFAQYRASGPGGRHEPWSLQVLELSGGRIRHIHHFLDTSLFRRFGLPEHPDQR